MAKKLDINSFLKLSPEKQAQVIERETSKLIARLPSLKKQLQMYNETSDEMYNLTQQEVEFQGIRYAKAVRGGEISTPASKQAYQNYIKNLMRYTRPNIGDIAKEVGEKRFESWWDTLKSHATDEDLAYANYLIMQMSEKDKLGFTRSKYFIDNANWNSKDTFQKSFDEGMISIQTLELELYVQKNCPHITTRNIYNEQISIDGKNIIRRGIRGKKKKG